MKLFVLTPMDLYLNIYKFRWHACLFCATAKLHSNDFHLHEFCPCFWISFMAHYLVTLPSRECLVKSSNNTISLMLNTQAVISNLSTGALPRKYNYWIFVQCRLHAKVQKMVKRLIIESKNASIYHSDAVICRWLVMPRANSLTLCP